MTALASRVLEPIDDDAPCGPDLDADFDAPYGLVTAHAEGVLPASFFEFNRAKAELPAECVKVEALLERSRDLRLLVLLAKFRILDRDMRRFVETLEAMAALLAERWETVHPQAEDGDYSLRVATLEALDDPRHVILPLQHVPLLDTRRFGAITFRVWQLASGRIAARETEEVIALPDVEASLADGDIDQIRATRDLVAAALAALRSIRASVAEGTSDTVDLGRLVAAATEIQGLVDGVLQRRAPDRVIADAEPGGAPAEAGQASYGPAASGGPAAPEAPRGALAGLSAQRAALDAVCRYFADNEPSSPTLLLARQARQLVGRSFADSVRLLVPSHASDAKIRVGERQVFTLKVESLADIAPADEREASDSRDGRGPETASFSVSSRRDALGLLQRIASDVRAAEPTSPIPLLCDQARALAERDFMSLIKEMLPRGAFEDLDDR